VPGPGNLGIFVTAGGTSQRPPIQAGYSFVIIRISPDFHVDADPALHFRLCWKFLPRLTGSRSDKYPDLVPVIHCVGSWVCPDQNHAYQLFLGSEMRN
jgi:hypothetical protein